MVYVDIHQDSYVMLRSGVKAIARWHCCGGWFLGGR